MNRRCAAVLAALALCVAPGRAITPMWEDWAPSPRPRVDAVEQGPKTPSVHQPPGALTPSIPPPGAQAPAAPETSQAAAPSAAAAQFAPAAVWPLSEDSSQEPRVHTLTLKDGRFLINGKLAEIFREQRGGADLMDETLVHPDDENLLVRVYQSPASLGGLERKLDKLQALHPLAAAGAAPKLLEHGETAVEGKGRVYFFVQERVAGRKLGELAPEQRPLAEVGQLFDRLKAAGLALIVPGPDPGWLLAQIMVGRTVSGGEAAYLLDGQAQARPPEELGAHYAMLRSILTPARSKARLALPPEPARPEQPPQPAVETAAAAPVIPTAAVEPPEKSADFLTGPQLLETARVLIASPGSDAAKLTAALIGGLNAGPQEATAELPAALDKALRDYLRVFADRTVTYESDGYGSTKRVHPLASSYVSAQPGGKHVGDERLTALIDVYRKLFDVRPDVARDSDVDVIRAAFATPIFGEDAPGDEVLVSELTKFAEVSRVLALKRPDLLDIESYADLLRGTDTISPDEYKKWYGGGGSPFRNAVNQLRAAMDEGFRQAAMKAPLDRLLSALARFEDGRWKAKKGFEERVERIAQDRPEFSAHLLNAAIPISAKEKDEARAAGDWTRAVLHTLPVVKNEEGRKAAMVAARAGWLAYRAVYDQAVDPVVTDPREFYARVFGIGQLLGTDTALGPKISLSTLFSEAEDIAAKHFSDRGYFGTFMKEVDKYFSKSANHARKLVQAALLKASVLPPDQASQFFWKAYLAVGSDGRLTAFRAEKQGQIVESLRARIPGLLRDLDAGAASNVGGVLLTGSFAYGTATPDSDLDLFLLLRPGGRDRTKEAIAALQELGRKNGWPPVRIPEMNVLPADGEQVRSLLRGFPCLIFTNDAGLVQEPVKFERFDEPTRRERMSSQWARSGFNRALRRKLP